MKKNILLIMIFIVAVGLGVGASYLFFPDKECADLDEEECRMSQECVSTLRPIPCEEEGCVNDVEFIECKDK